MTPRPKRPWSKIVEVQGIRVRLFEREPGGVLYREVRADGRKDRKSLGHRDRALAEQQVRTLAARLAEHALLGTTPTVTLGQLLTHYATRRRPLLSETRQREAKTRDALVRRHFGDGFVIDHVTQTDVDHYLEARRSGALQPKRRGGRQVAGVRAGTAGNDLRWLSAVCNWATGERVNGRRLLHRNPLRDLRWPEELNPKRPVASPERFDKTLAKADAVDPMGRFRCILSLARYTGRRENAIVSLRASDVLLSRDAILRTLAAHGLDERLADYMPHGAIRWREETDKEHFEDVVAIGSAARAALDAYLSRNPRVGEVPLFPAPRDAESPVPKGVAGNWLVKAERLAKLPKLERGRFHPYRRLFAVERKERADVDVAKAAGWRSTKALKRSYQLADAASVLRAIEDPSGTGNGRSEREMRPGGLTSDSPRKPSSGGASA